MLEFLCSWAFAPPFECSGKGRAPQVGEAAQILSVDASPDTCCTALLVCRSCGGKYHSATSSAHPRSGDLLTPILTAHLSTTNQIVSKSFTGRLGRACLVSQASNVSVTTKDERILSTGPHIVGDITCHGCGIVVGWK